MNRSTPLAFLVTTFLAACAAGLLVHLGLLAVAP